MFTNTVLPTLLLILLYSEAVVQCCSGKKVMLQVLQNSQENSKKEIPAEMFSCGFCEISRNIFFKEPCGRLLLRKHSLCLLSPMTFHLFKKKRHTYFLAQYFFGLICRLGTRVSSIFQTLCQKPIFNQVEHLRWSFFGKNINILKPLSIFAKKALLFGQALNTALQAATKRCSKVKN